MKKIIFSGTSHTLGLGLEMELHPRYSDVEWLMENGVFQSHLNHPIYAKEDYDICKTYRWTKLVSDELGYEEFNCHENPIGLGGGWPPGPIEFLRVLGTKSEDDLEDVEHIIIQTSHLRYNPIQGVRMLDSIQNIMTAAEMLEIIEDKNSSEEIKKQIYNWIENYDEMVELQNFSNKIVELKKQFPNIKFHILVWDQISDKFYLEKLKDIFENLIYITHNGFTSYSMERVKNEFKLAIKDVAFCYTQNKNIIGLKRWKESDVRDAHLTKLGHRVLADNVIQRLKKAH
jgi:hypothetical protein